MRRSSCAFAARIRSGMPMTEVQRGVRGQHVEVALAFDVGHPRTLGLGHDDGKRMVVVRGVLVGERDQLGRQESTLGLHGSHPPLIAALMIGGVAERLAARATRRRSPTKGLELHRFGQGSPSTSSISAMKARVSATGSEPSGRSIVPPLVTPGDRAVDQRGPRRKLQPGSGRGLPFREPHAGSQHVQGSTHRQDRIRLRTERRVLVETAPEAGYVSPHLVEVLRFRDLGDQCVDGRTEERDAVLSRRVPVEEEVPAGLDRVQRLARADPRRSSSSACGSCASPAAET